jgi:hypothetical protein
MVRQEQPPDRPDAFVASTKFGLPAPTLGESLQAQAIRLDMTVRFLREAYATAVYQFGEPQARAVWADVVTKRTAGRRPGYRARPIVDEMLLVAYQIRSQGLSERDRKRLPRLIAQDIKARAPLRWGLPTAPSLERRLRRRLKESPAE